MSELAARAEIMKLARELGTEPERLSFLASRDAGDLARFRRAVTEALIDEQRPVFQRIAVASKLVPAGLTARLATRYFGPLLSGRLATEIEPERAVKLTGYMEDEFLAAVSTALDPARSAPILQGMPTARVVAVACILAEQGEHVTIGRFVGAVSDETIDGVMAALDDDDLLLTAFFTEDPSRLDDLFGRLTDEELATLVAAGVESGHDTELRALLERVGHDSRSRLAALLPYSRGTSE